MTEATPRKPAAPKAPAGPKGPAAPAPQAAPQPAPQPAPMLESTARTYAMWAHLGPLLGTFVGIPAFAPALVIWLMGRDKSALVDHNGKEALNFHITITIATFLAIVPVIVIAILTLGLALIPLAIIAVLIIVWEIQAAMAASRGEYYRYPATLRLVK